MKPTRIRHAYLHGTRSVAYDPPRKLKREELPIVDEKEMQNVTGIVYMRTKLVKGGPSTKRRKSEVFCFIFFCQ